MWSNCGDGDGEEEEEEDYDSIGSVRCEMLSNCGGTDGDVMVMVRRRRKRKRRIMIQ